MKIQHYVLTCIESVQKVNFNVVTKSAYLQGGDVTWILIVMVHILPLVKVNI